MFLNRGISGNTLEDLKERWQKDATELHPDVISLLVGTNDVDKWLNDHAGMDFDIKAWGQDYRHLLSEALEQNPQLKLVLCTPFVGKAGKIGQQPTFSLREKYISACAAEVRIIAKEFDAVLIDYHQLFAELAKHQPRTDYWLWDGIHPTPAGHQRMADEWIKRGQAVLYP